MAEAASSITSGHKLAGKVAIITGGASGIGEATARLFAEQGVRAVVIADIQDDLGNQVAASIGSHRCSYVHCDVADEDQVKSLIEWTVNVHGQLDIMFSNAGILSLSDQTIVDLNFAEFDNLFTVNTRGTAACVKHAARVMLDKHVRGSIVCTASVAATHGTPRRTDYTMSKHAVLGLMRCASLQLAEHGIRVNCVSPNSLVTPLTCAAHGTETEELQKFYAQNTRLKGVFLTAKHIADAVLFLASSDSEFITGHDLVVDGGFARG